MLKMANQWAIIWWTNALTQNIKFKSPNQFSQNCPRQSWSCTFSDMSFATRCKIYQHWGHDISQIMHQIIWYFLLFGGALCLFSAICSILRHLSLSFRISSVRSSSLRCSGISSILLHSLFSSFNTISLRQQCCIINNLALLVNCQGEITMLVSWYDDQPNLLHHALWHSYK